MGSRAEVGVAMSRDCSATVTGGEAVRTQAQVQKAGGFGGRNMRCPVGRHLSF